ncbi:MAG: CRISPR-associated endonuclease Cas1 [Verrucomicrobia bacterium]|nr:CRISPR-associated endonuclease Cas1 [Verrucomicrobiota bacterium]
MIVTVQAASSKVRLSRHSIRILSPDGTTTRVPLADIDRLILGSRVSITPCGLAALLGKSIPVAIVTQSGQHLGSFEPPSPPRGLTRRLLYQATADEQFVRATVAKIVSAKITNARRALQRLNSRRPAFDKHILSQFSHLLHQVENADGIETLRGIEGAAAARYFALWNLFFPAGFPFEKRSTRPPLNPVNAVLSYVATLVYGEILSACQSRGLDPAPGCLHVTTDDRFSLPLDLMEPFRPALIEPLTLRLFSLGILGRQHFQPHGRGVYLNPQGKTLLFEQYEDRLTKPFNNLQSGCRTNFRALLAQAPLDFKMSLTDPSRFSPFLLH